MRWMVPDRNDPRWKVLEAINAATAQEYQRLQNRLRTEPAPDVVWTPDDLRYLRQWRISPA